MDVVAIPAGSATPKKVCIEMIGADPSAGQNWTLQNWLDEFRIGARATDQDSAFPQVYDVGTEEECDYNTSTTAFGFISPVQYEWSGNIQWEPGEYELTVTVKNSPDQHYPPDYIAAPSCTVPAETVTGKVKVVLFQVQIDGVKGPTSVERGTEDEYKVTANVAGMTDPPPDIKYNWFSNWFHRPVPTSSDNWKGLLVAGTTVNCDILVTFPADCFLIGGQTIPYGATKKVTLVTARSGWTYTPPGSAEFEEMADLGQFKACPEADDSPENKLRGRLVDDESKGDWIFTPNPPEDDPTNSSNWIGTGAVDIDNVGDGGPNHPLWWIGSADFEIKQLAQIAQYINEHGPPPPGATTSENWFNANVPCFTSPLIYFEAVKSHENLGERVLPLGGSSGHYGLISWGASLPSNDYKRVLEGGFSNNFPELRNFVNGAMSTLDERLNSIADPTHIHVKGNYSSLGGELPYRTRDLIGGVWSTIGGGRTCPCDFTRDF